MKRKFAFSIAVVLNGLLACAWISAAWGATYIVNSREDSGPGTLRTAVASANASTGVTDTISFSVGNSITVFSTVIITDPVILLGAGTTIGANADTSLTILYFTTNAQGSTIRDLALVDSGNGISLVTNNCKILGCAIGTDWNDTKRQNSNGIVVWGNGNEIGSPSSADRNIISGNNIGIDVGLSTQLKIRGNYIGTTRGGTTALANNIGVRFMQNVQQCQIGGNSSAGEGNVISGSTSYGVYLYDPYFVSCLGNSVCGNIIGLNASQTAPVPNMIGVVTGGGAMGNYIGLPQANYGNVISGNIYGMDITGAGANVIQNNLIGINPAGTALPNSYGIYINNRTGSGNLFGGDRNVNALATNVISGNNVGMALNMADGNTIVGNYFGTNAAGTSVLTNSADAIQLLDAIQNRIGGTGAGEGNLICGTANYGINANGPSAAVTGNTIVGNRIGVLANGAVAAQHFQYGIYLTGNAFGNSVGLAGTGQGNLIAGSTNGVWVAGANAIRNGIFGNTICGFSGNGITLMTGGNALKPAPVISFANLTAIWGTAAIGDRVEIFLSDRPAGSQGGSLRYLGQALAVDGNWSLPTPGWIVAGNPVCALATDTNNNTSPFSVNAAVLNATPTVTVTSTCSPTPTASPSASLTSTRTPSATITPTNTPTFTPTPTLLSPTLTPTVTNTATAIPGLPTSGVRIYPNPAKAQVHFAFRLSQASELKVLVFNLAGEKVAAIEGFAGLELVWDCYNIAPGLYLARMFMNGQIVKTEKFAIIH